MSPHDPVCPLRAQEAASQRPSRLVVDLHLERESMDIRVTNGKGYEVKVNPRNGKVIAISIGG